jgi:hypothetical protein
MGDDQKKPRARFGYTSGRTLHDRSIFARVRFKTAFFKKEGFARLLSTVADRFGRFAHHQPSRVF